MGSSGSTNGEAWALRGTIAHRAVLWPFTRPVLGASLERYRTQRDQLEIEAVTALELIEAALRTAWKGGTAGAYRTAEALLNVNGPADWTAELRHVTEPMSNADREIVFHRIRPLVTNGAHVLSEWIRGVSLLGDKLTCVWSEAPLFSVAGYFDRPNGLRERLRADVLGFRATGDIEVLDLKFGGKAPPEWRVKQDLQQLDAYRDAVRSRLVDEERKVTGAVFYVDSGPRTPHTQPWTKHTTSSA